MKSDTKENKVNSYDSVINWNYRDSFRDSFKYVNKLKADALFGKDQSAESILALFDYVAEAVADIHLKLGIPLAIKGDELNRARNRYLKKRQEPLELRMRYLQSRKNPDRKRFRELSLEDQIETAISLTACIRQGAFKDYTLKEEILSLPSGIANDYRRWAKVITDILMHDRPVTAFRQYGTSRRDKRLVRTKNRINMARKERNGNAGTVMGEFYREAKESQRIAAAQNVDDSHIREGLLEAVVQKLKVVYPQDA